MQILLFGRILDLIISLLTAVIVLFLSNLILPETLPYYFSMPIGMVSGAILGLFCGILFSFINVMFNIIMHTMIIGMLSGMAAYYSSGYSIAIYFAFTVWLVLIVSDEYYARIIDKQKHEELQ